MEVRISVRNLVEFILRSGDIDNRRTSSSDNAMAEGSRIHRMIQRRMGANYFAEVVLRYHYPTEEYAIIVEGRADGIIIENFGDIPITKEINLEEMGTEPECTVTIDEIKGTYRELNKLKDAIPVHLAQAKCYAFIYGTEKKLKQIRVRMTYCHLETEEIKYFHSEYSMTELKEWFDGILKQYQKWSDYEVAWKQKRQESINQLEFPFPYREGQKELATYVYQTIYHKKKLFIEAPTGVGKTLSSLYPSIKAMGAERGDKIFYLTAKTITRTVAENTYNLLRDKGLQFKTVTLTAKEKICFMDEMECNPEHCKYAKGHYDRINDAVYDLWISEDIYNRELLEEYALKHCVCPFEMGLDMSLFSDGITCDYNYVFDPHVYLRRFFSDGIKGNYLFLIDEAHNLVDRGREMYSAVLRKEDFLKLKKSIKLFSDKMEKQLEKCNKEMLLLKRECENVKIVEFISPFVQALNRVHATMEKFLEDHYDGSIRKEVLDFYFEICHFLYVYERVDDNYVMYTELQDDGEFILKLFCVNPCVNLKECMDRGRSSILFSATLLPIQYYKKLLGGSEEDYEAYAKSTFDPRKKLLLISNDVTSKYSRRSDMEFYNIASYIYEIVKNRHGNYIVFFPSYAFLKQIKTVFDDYFLEEETMNCIVQSERMNEQEREEFLFQFSGNAEFDLNEVIKIDICVEEEKSLIGFCVMGGIFSEGIDLKNDSLIGAIIVGTGLPQVCNEREILKDYFDELGDSGFDYAYRFPGMNKVLQSAGRVIRTVEDVGVIALLDERFLQNSYQRLFPREWEEFDIVSVKQVAKRVERFWDEWL